LPLFFFVFSLFQLFLIRKETDIKHKSLKVKHADIKWRDAWISHTKTYRERENVNKNI
jgi:hypothetical protein